MAKPRTATVTVVGEDAGSATRTHLYNSPLLSNPFGKREILTGFDTVNQEPIPGAAPDIIERACEVVGL